MPSLLSGSLRPFLYSSFVYSCHLLLISSASVRSILNLPAMQETWVRSLGWEDPLEKGRAYPLQYSCLENSMDRGAWQATVQGVAKSWDVTE